MVQGEKKCLEELLSHILTMTEPSALGLLNVNKGKSNEALSYALG